ncbi:hypothetical protein V8C40DRAFT_256923 [Trichoderma camerunense]
MVVSMIILFLLRTLQSQRITPRWYFFRKWQAKLRRPISARYGDTDSALKLCRGCNEFEAVDRRQKGTELKKKNSEREGKKRRSNTIGFIKQL